MTRLFSRILAYCTHRLRKVNLVLFLIICIIFTTVMRMNMENLMSHQIDSSLSQKLLHVTLPNVVVHIDLKGAPPRLDYLLSLLKLFKKFGVNGLLIEYEDMFPYEGRLERLRAPNYYEKEQLQKFLTRAADSGFEIIPLVQTFGHMEFLLKLKEFQQLCEVPFLCDILCPSHGETLPIIEDILKQIIQFHRSIIPLKHIHIGFNEVVDINQCSVCIKRELPKRLVFLGHLKAVTDIVKKLDNGTKILIWDDMIRPIDDDECNSIYPDKDLEPVYWDYQNKLTISHIGLDTYHKRFGNIWIASAFKGADGRTATFPNLKDRFENHLSWMNQIVDYTYDHEDDVFIFKGIILTGRSRYSHFAPPCELLPASIPSLLLNLLLIQRFKEGIPYKTNTWPEFYYKYLKSKIDEVFECNVCLEKNDLSNCFFEAKKLYTTIKHAEYKKKQFLTNYLYEFPWILMPDQYLRYNRINKRLTMHLINKYVKFGKQLLIMEDKLKKIMTVYFDDTVVQDYVGYTYYNIKRKVMKAFRTFCILLNTVYKNMRPIIEIATEKYLLELINLNNTVCITYNGSNNVSLSLYKNNLANYYRS